MERIAETAVRLKAECPKCHELVDVHVIQIVPEIFDVPERIQVKCERCTQIFYGVN